MAGLARGHRLRDRGALRLNIDVDDDTMRQIRERARRTKKTVAATVRDLIEWGLMEAEQERAA